MGAGSVTVYDAGGSIQGTYTTIQAGINACLVSGTVSVSAGTYTETVYVNKGIALVGVGTPTITAFGLGSTNTVTFIGSATNNASISGFKITGATGSYPNGIGIFCNNGSLTITNNTISGNNYGIYCWYSSPTITNNIITGNGGNGIFCYHSSPSITNNTISGNYIGIYCSYSSPSITNNIITGNNSHGIYCCYTSSSPTITNNTITGNNVSGIYCYGNSSPTITNNIITGNGITSPSYYGIYNSSGNPIIDYNCVWGNGSGGNNNYATCTSGAHDIHIDPQFIGGGDFHLGSSSPCIDAGSNTAPGIYGTSTDKDGNPRIYNNYIVDMGAYEFQGTPTANEKEWTFMVYLDGDNNLEEAGIDDFLEMAQIGSNDKINIVVQFDRVYGHDSSYGDWETTKRFYVTQDLTPDSANGIDIGEANMAATQTVIDFIGWAKENYPAKKYALVFWNHGGGWREPLKVKPHKAVCWDETSDFDCLYMAEVKEALSNNGADLIGFDACLMGMIEVAYQLKDYGDVAVFSQEVEPWDGWPYDTILSDLVGTPTMEAKELGKVIVERYMESYDESNVTQSAVDLKQLGTLATKITSFADSLEYYYDELKTLRSKTDHSSWAWAYADIYHFADLVSSIPEFKDSALSLKSAISESIIAEGHGGDHPNFHGMNIYFPKEEDWEYDDYVKDKVVDFPNHVTWDEFLVRFMSPATGTPVIKPLYRVGTGTPYTLEWSSVSGADYYEVQEESSAWQTICTSTETFATITGKLEEGYYYYRVRAIKEENLGNWSNPEDIWVGENTAPQITITNPGAEGTTTDKSFTIEFAGQDSDDTARISLYYDTDTTGYDGVFIASTLENDGAGSYTWNTSPIPKGSYYIYGLISDGKLRNPPIGTYSAGALTIEHGTRSWGFLVYLDGDNNLGIVTK